MPDAGVLTFDGDPTARPASPPRSAPCGAGAGRRRRPRAVPRRRRAAVRRRVRRRALRGRRRVRRRPPRRRRPRRRRDHRRRRPAPGLAGVPRPHRARPPARRSPRRRGTASTCSSCRACRASRRSPRCSAEPIAVNSMLGTYTNFVNLLDLCALTIPVGRGVGVGPPPSITLIGPAWSRRLLVSLAALRSIRPPPAERRDVGRALEGDRLAQEPGDVAAVVEQHPPDAERGRDLVDERAERRRRRAPTPRPRSHRRRRRRRRPTQPRLRRLGRQREQAVDRRRPRRRRDERRPATVSWWLSGCPLRWAPTTAIFTARTYATDRRPGCPSVRSDPTDRADPGGRHGGWVVYRRPGDDLGGSRRRAQRGVPGEPGPPARAAGRARPSARARQQRRRRQVRRAPPPARQAAGRERVELLVDRDAPLLELSPLAAWGIGLPGRRRRVHRHRRRSRTSSASSSPTTRRCAAARARRGRSRRRCGRWRSPARTACR